ncbi:hypothetical protein HYG81_07305 [Natrinema zhouii]|uniref:Uncharacterized protein n=1 Tax=Natrinema zhouii TaxID=1710539 RepID=A0A7D6CQJ5_9EURY|nr:HTH domain-containing protein [Natrinema zhouii]QLK27398.1 hypothetical protein HYG81_07305 [Natrinema zhouii]
MNIHTEELTVEAYIRSRQPPEPIDTNVETLHRLESASVIDDLSLHAWPDTIALSERTPHSRAVDAFERMQMWADEHEFSIRPPFSVRTTTSTYTDETRTTLRTPVMCLAVYADERLANVFPHSWGDERDSVADGIAALETADLEAFTSTPTPSASPPDRCPACDSGLTIVQGIGVCQGCDRIELGNAPNRDRGQRSHVTH